MNINNGGTLSTVAAGALTVGTVGSTRGLSASGTVTVTTYRGDITLADNIVTSNAGTAAITLNPGQYMPVGDTTSGNLIFNNGVSLTTGSGGRALLYTGAVANTNLTALVGSGSGRFRYGSTSSINNFTNWLGTSGLYAIYRERPTVSWSSTASQTFLVCQQLHHQLRQRGTDREPGDFDGAYQQRRQVRVRG
ncbi:MAG: hypothetical protein EBV69_05920 [Oxalobacteraceae bacterium]|nr:hypothetical protein [Oxalobacteraceae bacterium]